jgi:hypothetical protein
MLSRTRNVVARIQTLTLLFLIFGLAVLGQTPTGEITGTVTDSSGAIITDAAVTVTNPATGATRTAQTNASGIYDFVALPAGVYNLKIEKQGFNTEIRNNIEIQVAQIARIDTTLNLGNVSTTVNVEAGAPMLQTEDATVGTVVEQRRVEELPLNGRNFLSLTALTPGVSTNTPVNEVASSREGGTRGSFTVSAGGQRAYFNYYSLDGEDNTDVNYNAYIYLPSLDGIQEFKVETGVLPAEYGHNLTQVNVTTKSGSNELHGALFEFIRNADLDAKNYFDSPVAPIPPFKRNQFGADAGGPIKKNKLFFFADYEGTRERKSITKAETVPTQNEDNGNFTGFNQLFDPNTRVYSYTNGAATGVLSSSPFANNIIPSQEISPIAKAFLASYVPLPNVGGVNNPGPINYLTSLIQPTNNDFEGGRLDYAQSTSMTWMFRYTHSNEYQAVPGSFANEGQITNSHADQGMIGNTWIISPTKVNDFRIAVNYLSDILPTYNSDKNDVVAQIGFSPSVYPTNVPFDWGVPGLSATGLTLGGEIQSALNYDAHGNMKDNFSWIVGKHSFKFGGEYGRYRFNGLNNTYGSGTYDFSGQYTTPLGLTAPSPANSFADLLLGDIELDTGLFGAQVFNLRWNYFAAFAEDTWKVTPKLTVTYGLRWEDQTPPVSKYDNLTTVYFRWDNSVTPVICRAGTGDPYRGGQGFLAPPGIQIISNGTCNNEFNNDPLNFGPRAGLAYSLNSKTVLRAGGGLFFAHDIGNGFVEPDRNIPWSLIQEDKGGPVQPTLTLANPYPAPALPSFTSATERNEPTARSYEWSFGIQRELYRNASLEVNYVGSSSMYLPMISSYDTAPPGPGPQTPREPFPQFGGGIQDLHDQVHATYDSLQVKFQQRFTNGFTVLSSYSYGKAIDNGSSLRVIIASNDARNPGDPSDVRGLSSFDFRQRSATSFLYEIPVGKGRHYLNNANRFVDLILGGWQIGGILTLQSGLPFSPNCISEATFQNGGTLGDDPAACFPNATGINPNNGVGIHTQKDWFNTAAFVNQTPYSYGNAGRDTVTGPGIVEMDASLIKYFPITERQRLEFRAECFNIANHPIWGQPFQYVGVPGLTGLISNTIIDSREFQGALKYTF